MKITNYITVELHFLIYLQNLIKVCYKGAYVFYRWFSFLCYILHAYKIFGFFLLNSIGALVGNGKL